MVLGKLWSGKDDLLGVPVVDGHADPFVANLGTSAALVVAVLVPGILAESFDEFLDGNPRRSDGSNLDVSLGEFKTVEDGVSGWYSCRHRWSWLVKCCFWLCLFFVFVFLKFIVGLW